MQKVPQQKDAVVEQADAQPRRAGDDVCDVRRVQPQVECKGVEKEEEMTAIAGFWVLVSADGVEFVVPFVPEYRLPTTVSAHHQLSYPSDLIRRLVSHLISRVDVHTRELRSA